MERTKTREILKDLEETLYIADFGEKANEKRNEINKRKGIGSNNQPKKKKRK